MLSNQHARKIALAIRFEWSDAEQGLLAPLVDAVIVWADDRQLARLALPIVGALWRQGLRDDIDRALLSEAARTPGYLRRALTRACADLERGPEESRLARAVVEQAAADLAGEAMLPGHCLLCVQDIIERRPEERVAQAARAAAALAIRADPEFGYGEPDDGRRQQARDRVLALATLGERSVSTLARAWRELVTQPLPPPGDDIIWLEAVVRQRRALALRN